MLKEELALQLTNREIDLRVAQVYSGQYPSHKTALEIYNEFLTELRK